MSPPIDNNIDWTAASVPQGEKVVPSLGKDRPTQPAPARRSVMDTLLGENDLVATDDSGNDPYNATGRQFRR